MAFQYGKDGCSSIRKFMSGKYQVDRFVRCIQSNYSAMVHNGVFDTGLILAK